VIETDVFICNQGDTELSFAVAMEDGGLFSNPYNLEGWTAVKPVSCYYFQTTSTNIYIGFSQKDSTGRLAMAPYLGKLFNFPDGISQTDQPFCVKLDGDFKARNSLEKLADCGADSKLVNFSLHIDASQYTRERHWISLYFLPEENPATTKRTAYGEAAEKVIYFDDLLQTTLYRKAVSGLNLSKLPSLSAIENDQIRAQAGKQINDLKAKGYQMIECVYGPADRGGTGFRTFVFWHEVVPVTRREVLTISKDNPLWLLGNVALSECPDTHEIARRVHKRTIGAHW